MQKVVGSSPIIRFSSNGLTDAGDVRDAGVARRRLAAGKSASQSIGAGVAYLWHGKLRGEEKTNDSLAFTERIDCGHRQWCGNRDNERNPIERCRCEGG